MMDVHHLITNVHYYVVKTKLNAFLDCKFKPHGNLIRKIALIRSSMYERTETNLNAHVDRHTYIKCITDDGKYLKESDDMFSLK